jgi:ABC-type sugar transport system, permease component
MPSNTLTRTPGYVLTGGLAILFFFPIVWSAVASVSPSPGSNQVFGYGLGNYVTLYNFGVGLPIFFLNSAVISILTVCFVLSVSLLGGYAFAKFSFPGKNVIFLTTLAILMVPYATLLIPIYLLHNFARTVPILDQIASLNLVWLALVLGLFQLPFATYMMRISFESVPRELEEAALVDGSGTFGVFRHILLPAVRPGIVTVGLFAFLAAWNDFFAPLILINSPSQQPLPLALVNLRQQTMGAVDFGSTESGVVVMAIPCLILFLLLQRYYVRGFMSGAIKG